MPDNIPHVHILTYADDTAAILISANQNQSVKHLEKAINQIQERTKDNITINPLTIKKYKDPTEEIKIYNQPIPWKQ